jgi:deoxyadenosine/deoxycytidine kinase
MTKQKLVFFVGPDRCGKTEMAHELSHRTGVPYFKATSEHTSFLSSRVKKNDQFLNQLRFADPRVYDLLRQTGHSVIFDRGFPCEFAYSQVLGRETDMVMLRHMDESWASLNANVVFCHRTSYVGITDDLDPTINETLLLKLHEAYEEFFSWSKCRVLRLNVDDENLDREVSEIQQFISEE